MQTSKLAELWEHMQQSMQKAGDAEDLRSAAQAAVELIPAVLAELRQTREENEQLRLENEDLSKENDLLLQQNLFLTSQLKDHSFNPCYMSHTHAD